MQHASMGVSTEAPAKLVSCYVQEAADLEDIGHHLARAAPACSTIQSMLSLIRPYA